jgi:hypothetical protein
MGQMLGENAVYPAGIALAIGRPAREEMQFSIGLFSHRVLRLF